MAEENEEEKKKEGGEEGDEKKKRTVDFKLIGTIAALLVIMPIIAWFLVKVVIEPAIYGEQKPIGPLGRLYTFEAMSINLGEQGNDVLCVELVVSLDGGGIAETEVERRYPQLVEIVYDTISVNDRLDILPLSGRNRLKREIISRINEELREGKVIQAYFVKFLISRNEPEKHS